MPTSPSTEVRNEERIRLRRKLQVNADKRERARKLLNDSFLELGDLFYEASLMDPQMSHSELARTARTPRGNYYRLVLEGEKRARQR